MAEQSFRNHLLVALPRLSGDYFEHSVSLLVDHSDTGTFGLVINKPLANPITDLIPNLPADLDVTLVEGGPVEQEKLFFLHRPGAEQFESTFLISEDIALTTSPDFIEAMQAGKAPKSSLACLGYAGWGAEQLEHEMADDAWLLCPASARLVFDVPFARKAKEAARAMGIDLNLIGPTAGHD